MSGRYSYNVLIYITTLTTESLLLKQKFFLFVFFLPIFFIYLILPNQGFVINQYHYSLVVSGVS